MDTFNVHQFFNNDHNEAVVENVNADMAFSKFKHCITSVGARLGTTRRVVITDNTDSINAEWIHGKGIVYPTKFNGI